MSKEKLIPELRFPDFKNDGEWKIKNIDDLCDILNNIRKPITSGDRRKGSYPYYGASGIIDFVDDYLFNERLLLIGEDGAKWGPYENTAFLVEGKYWVNNHAHVLKPNLINDKLLESYLVKLDLHPYITGAAPPKLTLGKLKEIPVPVPNNEIEQQKIASCLSSLDEVIAAHSQKLELLKDHKKGLMQNLFPHPSTSSGGGSVAEPVEAKVPKYRFKEFENDGEWVEKTLESVTNKIGDGIHTTPKYEPSGEYYFINGNNLIEGEIFVDEKTKRVSISEFEIHKKDLTERTILLSINGTIGNVAFYKKEKVVLGKSACYIVPNKKLNNVFLYYSIQSPKISNYFISELTGSTIKNLSLKSIRETALNLPSEKEQQKVAICLSSLDTLIAAQTEKIEQLKLHKKGLMQGLFPKMSKVKTGHALS